MKLPVNLMIQLCRIRSKLVIENELLGIQESPEEVLEDLFLFVGLDVGEELVEFFDLLGGRVSRQGAEVKVVHDLLRA